MFASLREMQPKKPLSVGVIGLGAGVIAAWMKPGDRLVFYEISPRVVDIARREFTFLEDTSAKTEVVLGDGRLSLEREPPRGYDVLGIDAFSGDSIPMHLVTREAMAIYVKHLKPDGVIVFQATNRFIDLLPVVKRLAAEFGLEAVNVADEPESGRGRRLLVFVDRPDHRDAQPQAARVAAHRRGRRGDRRSSRAAGLHRRAPQPAAHPEVKFGVEPDFRSRRDRRFKQVDVSSPTRRSSATRSRWSSAPRPRCATMQRIACWTNLSETTFLLKSSKADYRLRIFTPRQELPFAGHPTIGSRTPRSNRDSCRARRRLVQECGAGLIELSVEDDGRIFLKGPAAKVQVLDGRQIPSIPLVPGAKVMRIDVGPIWVVGEVSDAGRWRRSSPT